MDRASQRYRKFIDPAWPYPTRLRARVLVGYALFTAVTVLANSMHQWVSGEWVMAGFALFVGSVAAMTPLVLRRTQSVEAGALLLQAACLVVAVLVIFAHEGMEFSLSWLRPLYVVISIYLLGPRYGVVFLVVYMLIACVDYVALEHGWVWLAGGVSPTGSDRVVINGTGLVLTALVFYVYSVAQRRTMGELADTLVVTEKNERQLGSVLESTSAAICSLDRELRLMAVNPSFVELAGSARLTIGDRLWDYRDQPRVARWLTKVEQVLAGAGRLRIEDDGTPHGRRRETVIHPITGDAGEVVGVTLFSEDIEDRMLAEEERRRLHEELAQASREAGMSTVATEVLHAVGNVLNSVGVSASMMRAEVARMRSANLERVVGLMEEHRNDLPAFLQQDPRGRRVLELLRALAVHFSERERMLVEEGVSLKDGVEQLTRVLRAQHIYARQGRVGELCSVAELVDVAMSLQAPSWARYGITVERHLEELPRLVTDRNRVIEILVNLIGNARHALESSDQADKRLALRAEPVGEDRVRIMVEDNGVGIAPEVLPKLFELGFTTKVDGTGLGLHAGANAARHLGGRLSCESEGPGKGARFILELPTEARRDRVDISQ
ncbi:sensor histidine kinase [Haliangium sp.]|uniref:sensor histidine kinase n=1 Tax=Haliangium sp. TaxID=2663208 RepID=UPI003D128B3E